MEHKEQYNIAPAEKFSGESPPYDDMARVVDEKGVRIGEAADMYGDLATAEEYGYVSRGYADTQASGTCSSFIANDVPPV